MRMAEAEKRMIQDDLMSDDMLVVADTAADIQKQTSSKAMLTIDFT